MTYLYTTIKAFKESFNSKLKPINENETTKYERIQNNLSLMDKEHLFGHEFDIFFDENDDYLRDVAKAFFKQNYEDIDDKYYNKIKYILQKYNIQENVSDNYLHINLLDKYKESGEDIEFKQKFEKYKEKLKGFKTVSEKTGLKAGDIIEFIAGYNMDIKYTTEILGFDEDEDIYLLQDCYQSPIRMEDRRAIKVISTNESKINENIDTTTIAKGLSDLNERRPERMKRPQFSYSNGFAMMRSGSNGGGLYIQDQAEEICQDKYGKEKGTKYWNGLIDAQRGAMFKACDEIIREKSYMLDTLKIKYNDMDYFQYSYFAIQKLQMDSIGVQYKILSQQEVDTKKAQLDIIKKRDADASYQKFIEEKLKKFNDEIIRIYQQFPGYENIKPDGKDIQRIEDMFNKRNVYTDSKTMANAIKDKNKAIKRGNAIIDYLKNKKLYEIMFLDYAKTFFRRATQL